MLAYHSLFMKMKMGVVTILMFISSFSIQAQSWTNPMILNGEWNAYGIGDPYILKYRGTFYLYCSTKDNNIGIKCWSSKDLVNWSGPFTCSTDVITKTAYAPEVVYWNGMFYMYTSPAGNGHYVLSSTSPTGPFTVVTSNLAKNIDGSIFINDDGAWYFYHANGNGIMGCSMSNPTTIGADVDLGCKMANNWTEGPCVFKRNGVYYLIYTGNHVISKGYRTDYAKNSAGPINSFTPQIAQNPILVRSEGPVVGLGHGSAFIGPDLDSYYFCYHNLESGVGPLRHLNIDRIVWNGDKMMILGPTVWTQQTHMQPDFFDYFDRTEIGPLWQMPKGGSWIMQNQEMLSQTQIFSENDTVFMAIRNQTTQSNYTAEFNLRQVQSDGMTSGFGAMFGYLDENNYGIALLHSNTNKLEINFKINGTWGIPNLYSLPAGYNYTVWHTIRMEKTNSTYKFFVDNMLKSTVISTLGAGKIGYITSKCRADFGFIAFSSRVNGSGIFDIYKPVPGKIQAVHYNNGGEGISHHDVTQTNSGGKYIRNDNVDVSDCSEGGFAVIDNQSGEWYKYNINVKESGAYNLGLRYSSAVQNSQIRIWMGDTDLSGIVNLPTTNGAANWRTFTIKELALLRGVQTIKIEIVTGGLNMYELNFVEAENSVTTVTDLFESTFATGWNYSDGTWTIQSGEALVSGYGKRTIGNTGWTDYTLQTEITYTDVMNGGLIFRVNNPALGGAGNNSTLGTDFYQGYFVTLSANNVVLGKQNYNWVQLATGSGSFVLNKKYSLKVIVSGANIKVFVDNMNTPLIDYNDLSPFVSGKVGLRSFNSNIRFDNFSVSTKNDSETDTPKFTTYNNIKLFPNPVSDVLMLENIEKYNDVAVFNANGEQIYNQSISGERMIVNTSKFEKGLYLLRFSSTKTTAIALRKFIKN